MDLIAGVTKAPDGLDGTVWNILGQTYTPKLRSDNAFVWHAVLPADSFVPPHIHPTQDEWIFMLDGNLELVFGEESMLAGPGDTVRMPMGKPHGIFNKSGAQATCLFGVSPTRKLFDLFGALHNLADVDEVVRLSGEHEVNFLPPPPGA
jgi:uncharacterized cupin superfamily protein